ncbi:MAG: tRNA preQ1(34) S-adenosylmethionine ribosyltransferase-isomerase QueA, partial [Nitrospinae bacterium RIFCSPLOWO2_12_FULL_47_7]
MIVHRETGEICQDIFSNFTKYFTVRPLMVFNNTRVFPAKLYGHKRGAEKSFEILMLREHLPSVWEVLIKGLGKIKVGTEITFGNGELAAILVDKNQEHGFLQFQYTGDFVSILNRVGKPPLPPYIRRGFHDEEELQRMDRERYQTIYAEKTGAIAAPTAGLHFTPTLLDAIKLHYADTATLTLHVGAGTFQSPRHDELSRHKMEKEYFNIPSETWNRLLTSLKDNQKILAVGTTATRALESVEINSPVSQDVSGWTDRFIHPGQKFNIVQQLLTNFHLPKSTLYLLVCAFAGKSLVEKAYNEAIRQKYRFFSYGDAMLI